MRKKERKGMLAEKGRSGTNWVILGPVYCCLERGDDVHEAGGGA